MNSITTAVDAYRRADETLFERKHVLLDCLHPILNIENVANQEVEGIDADENGNVSIHYCQQNWGPDRRSFTIPGSILQYDDIGEAWKRFKEEAKQAAEAERKANQTAADMARLRELQARYPGIVAIKEG